MLGGPQQRVHRPDQPPIGGQVEADDLAPQRRVDMAERREHAELAGIADQDVEPAIALVKRGGQLIDLDEIAQVEGHQRRAAAGGTDPVVGLFEATDRAAGQDEMGALAGEPLCHRRTKAAGGAGDQRDLAGEPARHRGLFVAEAHWILTSFRGAAPPRAWNPGTQPVPFTSAAGAFSGWSVCMDSGLPRGAAPE